MYSDDHSNSCAFMSELSSHNAALLLDFISAVLVINKLVYTLNTWTNIKVTCGQLSAWKASLSRVINISFYCTWQAASNWRQDLIKTANCGIGRGQCEAKGDNSGLVQNRPWEFSYLTQAGGAGSFLCEIRSICCFPLVVWLPPAYKTVPSTVIIFASSNMAQFTSLRV